MSNATVREIKPLAPDVLQITMEFDRKGMTFVAGQYVNLRLSDDVSRAYCIASAQERPDAIQLCIRLGKGRGSNALRNLKIGQSVEVDGPHGSFMVPNESKDLLFIAGDTGIAPVRSIVLHLRAERDERGITVLYEPAADVVLYAADFEPLARSGSIRYERGSMDKLLETHREALAAATIMAAGFEDFLGRVKGLAAKFSVPSDRIFYETFGALP